MMTLSHSAAVMIGVVLAIWLGLAGWALWSGLILRRRAEATNNEAEKLGSLIESSPALPLIIRNDGKIEAQRRLADWLGLVRLPGFVSDLAQADGGLSEDDAALLARNVNAAQKAGKTFVQTVKSRGSSRTLQIKGGPAVSGVGQEGTVVLWVFDITDSQNEIHRLTDQSARNVAAAEALSALIEAAPMPMWHRGPDFRLDMVNSAYVRAVEADSAEDVVQRGLELVDIDRGMTPIAAAAAAQEKQEIIIRTLPATIAGSRRAMRIVDVPLGDVGVAGYAIDIEDLEQSHAAFRQFADTQRDTLDRLSAGVAQFAADRSLVFCNLPFQALFGIKPEWVGERPDFDRLFDRMREAGRLPETRDFVAWRAERREWFTANSGAIEENWLIPGGQHLRLLAQPLPDGGLLLIFEDRTEQAQLASARDTLLRVRTATFDNLFEAVGVFEADGRLHLWNNRFRQVWGLEEAYLGQHPRVDVLAEAVADKLTNPSRAKMIRELVKSATVDRKQRSGRFTLKDGKHFEFAAVPLPDGNALFIMLDITDSRKVETALRERTTALEAADKIKTAFVANMSYELRTPLTSIQGFAEMLQSGLAGALDPRAKEYVDAILESTERLGTLVDNVLDLTQGDAGALPMENKLVDLVELTKRAAGASVGLITAKNIDFAPDIHASVGSITGDAKRLRQAVDHLLRNALTYTPKNGRVLLHASGDADSATIVVSDNGPGMDEVEQAAALDRFSRVRGNETRGGEPSVGLGLPLARQFVEMHDGTLTLMSEPGTGTAVKIELPRK